MMTAHSVQRILAVALAATVLPGAAAAAPPAFRLVDDTAERRLVLYLQATGSGTIVEAGTALPRTGLLHRVEATLLRADGTPATGEWEAVVSLGGGALHAPAGRVNRRSPRHDVPRPLGVAFHAGDTLRVRATVAAADTGGLELRITLHYEAGDAGRSRIPVIAVGAAPAAGAGAEWEWHAPADGRLLAVTGLHVSAAGMLVLQDAATGDVVWRETVQPRSGPAFGAAPDAIRSGVAVEGGRAYRLTLLVTDVTADSAAAAAAPAPDVRAMIAVAARH
jgi:hypothetical protein